ncbi:DUF4124 domain-containing protein [Azomonas macrocytogenes]|uniref:DUF4124 domain-containing protein n=1 Tax=Azomonas macrocytogenes TaxID=69962 RepID=A0A839T782_AZOMA|nr:DUF4124 domain-containing protein [Azomonas macrocytogenes]MBB3104316.1 hypothetical protein [Azomonas macrocytogenes]
MAYLHYLSGLLLYALISPAYAEVFRYKDANGNPLFTDQPRDETARPVEIRQSLNSLPTITSVARPTEPPPKRQPLYAWLRITHPLQNETLRDNTGNVEVFLESEPALQPGHTYVLWLDGKPGDAQQTPPFLLHNLDRGSHRLTAEIVDSQGNSLTRSLTVTIHIKRMSLSQRKLARPCRSPEYGIRPECPMQDKPEEE